MVHPFLTPASESIRARASSSYGWYIRMIKVRLKISGCFRTVLEAEHFARIRSYLSKARKQGRNILESITAAIEGKPFLPVASS